MANGAQADAALRIGGQPGRRDNPSEHCLVEDCNVYRSAGTALSVAGNHHVIRRCRLNDNGQNGLHVAGAHHCFFQDIQYARNNLHPGRAFDIGWEAVMKCASSTNNRFDRLHSLDNHGMGFWVDGPVNLGNTLTNSRIEGNSHQGIRIEIAFTTTIRNNLLIGNGRSNGQAAIQLSSSIGTIVENNTIVDNQSMALVIEPRLAVWRKEGWEMSTYDTLVRRNVVANNQRAKYQKSWQYNPAGKDVSNNLPQEKGTTRAHAYGPNVSDDNVFWIDADHPSTEPIFISGGVRTRDLAKYQEASGVDANSRWTDPFVGDSYRIMDSLEGYGADLSQVVEPHVFAN